MYTITGYISGRILNIRLAVLLIPWFLFGCKNGNGPGTEDEPRPNIIFILADDLGYNELSCYGQENFTTRHVDRLAAEGMRFTDFYAGNTVSGPSRCCLVTGKHPGHASVRGNLAVKQGDKVELTRAGITAEDMTIGEILQQAGYKTALCGKWHLEHFNDTAVTWPVRRGFDYVIRERWNTELNAYRRQYREETGVIFDYNYPYELWENGKKVQFEGNIDGEQRHLMDDIVTGKGLEFIKANQNSPFFVFFSLKIPHNPETFSEDRGQFRENDWPECERIHAVRILHMDELVDRIVRTVDSLGLAENTLIIFSSDNGGHSEGGYLEPEVDPCKHDYTFFSSNAPLRGYKRDLYDGGIRVPMIVRWKGTIRPGQVSAHIGAFWDLMPTFAELAGIEVKYDHDGLSFLPTLLGNDQPEHDYLYWEFLNPAGQNDTLNYGFLQAVRMGRWKGVRYGIENPVELFDLSKDIGEQRDLSAQYPELVQQIDSIFRASSTPNPLWPYGGFLKLDMSRGVEVVSY